MIFRAVDIEGPRQVTLADGKNSSKGYVIKADRRTIRQPGPKVRAPFKGWHAIGQIKYFNAKKMQSVLVGNHFGGSNGYIDEPAKEGQHTRFHSHTQGIPGMNRNHPEAILVDQYVSWMSEETRFGHNYIRDANLYVDLFDLTHWQLIEAKATTSREAIRMAIGQLRDYKRYYNDRHPTLAALLPARPTASCMRLLTDNRITVIWRTRGGKFGSIRWQDYKK